MNGIQKRHVNVIESIKNIIIAILFLGVIVLSGMYIVSLNESRKLSVDSVTFDKLRTVQNETNSSILSEIITPQFIGIKENGFEPVVISSGSQAIEEIYRKIGIYLYYALSDGAGIDDGESSTDWIPLLTSYNYIYVKYHSPLPHQLIQASGGVISGSEYNDYTRKREGVIYIDDLFIIPVTQALSGSESHEYRVVVRASDGKIYIFTPPVYKSDEADLNEDRAEILYPGIDTSVGEHTKILADIYKNDMQKYHFSGKAEKESDMYLDPASVVVVENIPVKKITADANTANIILSDITKRDTVMKIFSFNPNKPKTYYEESSKTQIYVETHGLLKISNNRIVYTAKDGGGIPVSDYTGYNSSGSEGDIYDITVAAQKILKSMISSCGDYIGKDAVLRISAVYSKDGKIAVEYSYYYNNTEIIVDGREYGLLIESDGINITLVDFYTLSVSASSDSSEKILSYTQNWAAEKYIGENSENFEDISSVKIKEMCLVYTVPYNINSENTEDVYIVPEWYISVVTVTDEFTERFDNEIKETG